MRKPTKPGLTPTGLGYRWELTQIYKVHPAMITAWKRQLVKGSASIFEKTHEKDDAGVDVDSLYKKIGSWRWKGFFSPLGQESFLIWRKAPDDRPAGQATHCKTV